MLRLSLTLCLLAYCLTACFAADITPARIPPPTTISGKVLGPDSKPVAGAEVLLTMYDRSFKLTTDLLGVFSAEVKQNLDGRPRLVWVIVRANGLGLGGAVLKLDAAENVITLTLARQLTGTVLDATGKPVEGVTLSILEFTTTDDGNGDGALDLSPWQKEYTAKTDVQGQWTINGLSSAGSVTIAIDDSRFVQMQNRIKLGAGEPAPRIIILPAGTITGRLLGIDGKPAANIMVTMRVVGIVRGVLTNAEGAFRISRLPTGKYQVHVENAIDYGMLENVEVVVTEGQITTVPELKLQPGTIIDGNVLEEETEKPVPHVMLVCYGPEGLGKGGNEDRVDTDEQGHFRLRVLPGKRTVSVLSRAAQYLRDENIVEFDAIPGATQTLVIHLRKGVSIAGSIVDEQGKQLPGLTVLLCNPKTKLFAVVTADANGAFQCDGLQKGQATLSVYEDINVPLEWEIVQPQQLDLPVTGPVNIVCKKIRLTTLTGRVVTTTGKPVDGAKVTLDLRIPYIEHTYSSRTSVVTTDAGGRYSLDKLKPGTQATVKNVEKTDYRLVSLGDVQHKDIDLAIDNSVVISCNGTAQGRVVDEAGKPVAGAHVIVLEDGIRSGAITDATGNFSLKSLPEGEITLFAAQGKRTGQVQTVTNNNAVTITLTPVLDLTKFDVKRIDIFLDEFCEYLKGASIYVQNNAIFGVAGKHPEYAYKMAVSLSNTPEYLLPMIVNRAVAVDAAHAVEWGVPHIAQTRDRGTKAQLLATLGMAAIATDRDLAVELYRQLKELGAVDQPQEQATYYIQLLQFAGRLRNGEEEQQFASAMKYVQQVKNQQADYQLLAIAAAASSPALAEKVLAILSGGTRDYAVDLVIAELARNDPSAAVALLEKRFSAPDFKQSNMQELMTAVKTLVKIDAKAVLALSQKIDFPDIKVRVMLSAAAFLPAVEAQHVYQDAVAIVPQFRGPKVAQLVQIAVRLYELDPVAGQKLFMTARELMETNEYERSNGLAIYTYYYSRVDPIESRLLLEAEYAQAMKNINRDASAAQYAHDIPQAMAVLDVTRALEMAKESIAKAHGSPMLSKILDYLLATPEEHKWGFFQSELQ